MRVTKIFHLPQYLRQLRKDINTLSAKLQQHSDQYEEEFKGFAQRIEQLEQAVEHLQTRNVELEHATRLAKSNEGGKQRAKAAPGLFANNHELDAFYLAFENQFRGTESEIKQKQQPYLEIFQRAAITKKLPIIDLGSGRGEFLELVANAGLNAIGVDLNASMVKRARERGFEAVENDAISFLTAQPGESLAGITGFHLAEHIPFDQVLTLLSEAYRCLAKGGILLLETPDPENVYVGAFTFHYDPSHLKPLPPAIMQFSAMYKGFSRAEIMRLQPELTSEQIIETTENATLQEALRRLFGPRDYALVAYK